MKISIQGLLWHTRRYIAAFVAGFGWPGMLAIVLFSLCAAVGVFVLRPVQDHIVGLKLETENLRLQTKNQSFFRQKVLSPAEQLAEFYRFFPRQASVSRQLAKLYNAATQQNLNLDQGEYHLAHDKNGKLIRYDIVLPIKGGYVPIRKFIAQALLDVPSLSLDGVSFGRQKIDDAMVDAQLRFTLYLGEN